MQKKILIVDDEPHIRLLLEQTLEDLEEGEGVRILLAPDGESGLAMIVKERPALVFLDIMMPGMSGYEVCREVRDRPELKNTRVILLTAKGQVTGPGRGDDKWSLGLSDQAF